MKNDSINRLSSLLAQESRNTILLDGEWGVGKTYEVKQLINSSDAFKNKKRAYISLFGINTIAELKESLLDSINIPEPKELTFSNIIKKARLFYKSNGVEMTFTAPGIRTKINIEKLISLKKIDDYIICIDDIERRGKSLSLKETLGYISFLSENYKCNIICICNTTYLDTDDQDSLKLLYEKVFGYRLRFKSTPEQSLTIALKKIDEYINTKTDDWVVEILSEYEEKNIRLIVLVLSNYYYFNSHYKLNEKPLALQKNIARIFIACCYAHLHYAILLKTFEFVIKSEDSDLFKPTESIIKCLGKAKQTSQFREYHEIITNYLVEHDVDINKFEETIKNNLQYNRNVEALEKYASIHNEIFETKNPSIENLNKKLLGINENDVKYLDFDKTRLIIKYKSMFSEMNVEDDINKLAYTCLLEHPNISGDLRDDLLSRITDESLINKINQSYKENTPLVEKETQKNIISLMQLYIMLRGIISSANTSADHYLAESIFKQITSMPDIVAVDSLLDNLPENTPPFLEVMYAIAVFNKLTKDDPNSEKLKRYNENDKVAFVNYIKIINKSKDKNPIMKLRIETSLKGLGSMLDHIPTNI